MQQTYILSNDDQVDLLRHGKPLLSAYAALTDAATENRTGPLLVEDAKALAHTLASSILRLGNVVLPGEETEGRVLALHARLQPLLLSDNPMLGERPITKTEALQAFHAQVKEAIKDLPRGHPSTRLLISSTFDKTRANALAAFNRARRCSEPEKADDKVGLLAFRLLREAAGQT